MAVGGRVAVLVVTLTASLGVPRAAGQAPAATASPSGPLATVHTWADQIWAALLDRDGSWHGRLADEGTFQRFNAAEDDEYQLDLRTALFSPSDDARWDRAPGGLRAAAASIDHPHIVQTLEWRERFPVSDGWTFEGAYVRERTLSARRDQVQPGVFWQPGGGPWEFGATLGLHYFKSSADVELLAGREWAGPDGARGRVNVRVAALDAFNELIFHALGVDPEDVDAHFDYEVLPFALRADGAWTSGSLRLEVRGGASRRSRVRVSFPARADAPYELSERVAFLGAAVEAGRGVTSIAAHGTFARADTERLTDSPSPLDLSLRETTWSAGLRARQVVAGSLWLEADLARTLRPEDRATAWRSTSSRSVELRDREWFTSAALIRRPPTGWTARLMVASLDRNADPILPRLTASNQRLVLDAGFISTSGFELSGGLRWDLDALGERAFDGAQLRITSQRR
jgi:hypothetical protein